MKRITQQINPSFLKRLKKNNSHLNIKKVNTFKTLQSFNQSEIAANKMINYVLEIFNKKLEKIIMDEHVKQIIKVTNESSKNLETCLCPQEHQIETKKQIHKDQEPQRVSYDPICGFNRLVTLPNKRQDDLLIKKSSTALSSSTNIYKENLQHRLKEKTQKLIPLKNITEQDERQQESQLVQRDRRIFEARNLLINTSSRLDLSRKSSKKLEQLKKIGTDEYFYGFNGEKYSLNSIKAKASYAFGGMNVLKTSYKINSLHTKQKLKERPSSLITSGTLKKSQKSTKRQTINLLRESHKNLNQNHRIGKRQSKSIMSFFRQPSSEQGMIKTMMETQFKRNYQKNIKFKQRPQRLIEKML